MEEDEIPPDFELCQDRLRQYQKRAKPVLFMIEDTESRLEEERLRYLFCGVLSGSIAVLDRLLVFLDNFFSKGTPFLQAILDKIIERLVINEFSKQCFSVFGVRGIFDDFFSQGLDLG